MDIDLFYGDFRDRIKSLDKNSVDFIFTDPPYGININSNGDMIHRRECIFNKKKETPDARKIKNDDDTGDIMRDFFKESSRLLKPGSVLCCCAGGGGAEPVFAKYSKLMEEFLEFKQMIVWDKGKIGMGWHYRRSYEVILIGVKKGSKCKWFDNSHKIENVIRPGDFGIKKIIPKKNQHPTAKPPELAAHFIKLHTQPGEIVFDPFMGGGSTGVACMQTGRNFIGCELDPVFYKMSKKNIQATEN